MYSVNIWKFGWSRIRGRVRFLGLESPGELGLGLGVGQGLRLGLELGLSLV